MRRPLLKEFTDDVTQRRSTGIDSRKKTLPLLNIKTTKA